MASSAGAIRAGAAFVELFTKDSASAGLDKLAAKLRATGAAITAMGARAFAAGALMVTPLVAAAKLFGETGSELLHMSQRTGVSVEQLSALGYVAEQSGIGLGELETSFKRMQKSVTEASPKTIAALHKIGLTVADLKDLSPDQQFIRVGDAIGKLGSAAERTSVAVALYGRTGTRMLPLFAEGAGGIKAMTEEAERLGVVMSTEDAKAAEQFERAQKGLTAQLKMTAVQIGSAVAPALQELIGWMRPGVTIAIEWVKQHKAIFVAALMVGGALMGIGLALMILGPAFTAIGAAISVVSAAFGILGFVCGIVKGIAVAMWAALGGPVTLIAAGVIALGAVVFHMAGGTEMALGAMSRGFQSVKKDAIDAWGGISAALEAGDIASAAKVAWAFLKLEWTKGVNWIAELWQDFSTGFKLVFWDACAGIAHAFNAAISGLHLVWAGFVMVVRKAWAALVETILIGWARARYKADPTYTKGDRDKAISKARGDRESASEAADSDFDAAKDAGKERDRRIDRRREKFKQDALDKNKDDHARHRGEEDAARKELDDAIQAAKDAAAARKKPPGAGEKPPTAADTAAKADVIGTFGAASAGLLGYGTNLAERTAVATERTAKATERMADGGGLDP